MNRLSIAVPAAALVMLVAGCASTPYPEKGLNFGYAVNSAKQAQVLYPQGAQRDPANVSGIDGRAAKESMDRYVESFKAPPPTVNVFNIGGSVNER